jgi:hypothetical protein
VVDAVREEPGDEEVCPVVVLAGWLEPFVACAWEPGELLVLFVRCNREPTGLNMNALIIATITTAGTTRLNDRR